MSDSGAAGEDKLKWMYEGKKSSIDHEQYLLGKRITTLQDDDEEKGDFSIAPQQSSVATGNVTVLERLDYESKVREDPLFQIRKNDYEHRKELLSNPFKKKRIQSMLKNALERDLRRSHETKHMSESRSSSASDSSSDSDEVGKKFSRRSLKDEKLRKALKAKLERDLMGGKRKSPTRDHQRSSKHENIVKDESQRHSRHSRIKDTRQSSSSEDDNTKKAFNKRQETKEIAKKAGYGLSYVRDGERKTAEPKKRRERRTPSPEHEKPRYVRKHKSGFSRKLTEEERDKKRKEMMDNASWRGDQRKLNVKKFALEEKKEKDREERAHALKRKAEEKGGNANDFLHEMKLHSASVGSIEDTVRRKKHTLSKRV